ncbi:MAG: hypothetical protein WHS64_03115 [Fervidobacterium sp.]|uniref:hypothetical protein n=1 Tax=Fervidobacterium TaxID=2422 RepID=UPI0030A74CFC
MGNIELKTYITEVQKYVKSLNTAYSRKFSFREAEELTGFEKVKSYLRFVYENRARVEVQYNNLLNVRTGIENVLEQINLSKLLIPKQEEQIRIIEKDEKLAQLKNKVDYVRIDISKFVSDAKLSYKSFFEKFNKDILAIFTEHLSHQRNALNKWFDGNVAIFANTEKTVNDFTRSFTISFDHLKPLLNEARKSFICDIQRNFIDEEVELEMTINQKVVKVHALLHNYVPGFIWKASKIGRTFQIWKNILDYQKSV